MRRQESALKRSDVLVTGEFLVSCLTGQRSGDGTVEKRRGGQVLGVNECMGVCCCVCAFWSVVRRGQQ